MKVCTRSVATSGLAGHTLCGHPLVGGLRASWPRTRLVGKITIPILREAWAHLKLGKSSSSSSSSSS
eukprot:3289103-Karenia_brevis.AAC.1